LIVGDLDLWLAKYWWTLPLFPLAAAVAAAILIVPFHARRRGHGFFSWFVLQFVALNPVYPLVLVAILPHKARMRLRTQFERELDERLEAAGIHPGRAADLSLPSSGTVGDRVTEGSVGPSVGDLPTRP
jgi:hypothetical protein